MSVEWHHIALQTQLILDICRRGLRKGTSVRLLLVEDDARLVTLLERALREDGYAVDSIGDGDEALWMATEKTYDVIVLDGMLPGMDGIEVIRMLRARERWMPILMLTARSGVDDRVDGLDAGADDYLAKPFDFEELTARIRALVRRGAQQRPVVLSNGDLTLDPAARWVARRGTRIELTAKEFALLELLMRHRGDVLTRTFILEHAWDFAFDPTSNIIDQYMASLRRKIDRPFGHADVETVRGAGYRLRRDPAT